MKFSIGVPLNYGVVYEKFWWSFVNLQSDKIWGVTRTSSAYLWDMRNNLVKQFLELPGDVTHLIMIDADMEFPSNLIDTFEEAIMAAPKYSIIGIPYMSREGDKWHIYEYTDNYVWRPCINVDEGLIERDAVGTGLICIPRVVFHKMKFPWFEAYFRNSTISEDLVFCKKARELEFKIVSTPPLEGVSHLCVS